MPVWALLFYLRRITTVMSSPAILNFIQNDYIIDIMITNTLDHYYDSHIKNTTYIKDIINNQNNLDNVDTISGATYTSSYLKEMTKSILKYHGDKYEK